MWTKVFAFLLSLDTDLELGVKISNGINQTKTIVRKK
jgi:hypothetical protein